MFQVVSSCTRFKFTNEKKTIATNKIGEITLELRIKFPMVDYPFFNTQKIIIIFNPQIDIFIIDHRTTISFI